MKDNLPSLRIDFFGDQLTQEPRYLTQMIVKSYRMQVGFDNKPLSFARFAKSITKCVTHLNLQVSHQTIKNWEDGMHRPDYFFTLQLANHAPEGSWQRAFAMDLLAVQWPMLYQPGSEIGEKYSKELLQNP